MTVKSIKIIKNKIIKNNKGNILKFVSNKSSFFKKFGEVYFNEIKINYKKGWTKHTKNNCIIQCIKGKILFHLIDNKSKEKKIILSEKNAKLIKIPPGIWFAFESLVNKSMLVNLIEHAHSDEEIIKKHKIKNYIIH